MDSQTYQRLMSWTVSTEPPVALASRSLQYFLELKPHEHRMSWSKADHQVQTTTMRTPYIYCKAGTTLLSIGTGFYPPV